MQSGVIRVLVAVMRVIRYLLARGPMARLLGELGVLLFCSPGFCGVGCLLPTILPTSGRDPRRSDPPSSPHEKNAQLATRYTSISVKDPPDQHAINLTLNFTNLMLKCTSAFACSAEMAFPRLHRMKSVRRSSFPWST